MPLTCNNSMRVALASQGLWVACVTADTSSFEQSVPRTFCSWPYAGWLMSSNESTWNRVWPLHEMPFPCTFKICYTYMLNPLYLRKKIIIQINGSLNNAILIISSFLRDFLVFFPLISFLWCKYCPQHLDCFSDLFLLFIRFFLECSLCSATTKKDF